MDDRSQQPPAAVLAQLADTIRATLGEHHITITARQAHDCGLAVLEALAFDALIEASSLGSPEAKASRDSIPPEVKAELREAIRDDQWRGVSFAERIIDLTEDEDMNGGPTNPEDRPVPSPRARADGAVLRTQGDHYVSTACVHDRHEDCRWTCKWCNGQCRCSCHIGNEPHAPASGA